MREHLYGPFKNRPWSDENIRARLLFGNLIKARRQEKHFSLQYVADTLNVSRQAVWTWEHLAYPSDFNLDELCILLGLDYYQLRAMKETA